ncbi:hypothetical protein F4777DRAFT_588826 [Nemania sp. FL0916]|nr:hypothetical protein F4777DRAFT_588826 [Nemania sp. FL0916]
MSDIFDGLGVRKLLDDLEAAQTVLKEFKASIAAPDVITDLTEQIDDLFDIAGCFDRIATAERRNPSAHAKLNSAGGILHFESVLNSTAEVIDECTVFIQVLRSTVENVVRASGEAVCTASEAYFRNQDWYEEVYCDLRLRAEALRALFTAIDLLQCQNDTDDTSQYLKARSSISTQLHHQIGLVERSLGSGDYQDTDAVQKAVRVATAVTIYKPPVPNKHFVIVRPVRSYFTGRVRQLAKLEAAFRDTAQSSQLRFVIYGLSGSGKTELAFKFADEYRDRFWGVFFVDGSSRKNASSSYAEIATLGGVEPNEKAAKNWLATRDLPWLLIIDNVDREEINVDELLPSSAKGCVLITTRNPGLMTYGNSGDRYLELMPMEPSDAETLIIKAAEEPRPWRKVAVESAASICHTLGFLPLALVQAAKAILNGICDWGEYLSFYDRETQRIRRMLHGRNRKELEERKRVEDDSNSLNVFSTYEILYESLVSSQEEKYKDAVELLHVFSFFHFQNIRLDTLISAATNPLREERQRKDDEILERELHKKLTKKPRKPWSMFLRELRALANNKLASPIPLPAVLRNPDGLGLNALEDEADVRLRYALGVLIERSLVVKQDRSTGRYSMHRLVHKWIRERPEMSTAHQALWCQVSMTTLAMSIRQPPYGDSKEESEARRELLPHIRHATTHHVLIEKRLEENALTGRPIWSLGNNYAKSYGRLQAEQDVRFSRVYAETGVLREACELQERALAYVSGRLGPDHPLAIWLSLFLSKTLWELSEADIATQKQRQARQLCLSTWGEDHPLTLDVTDLLGAALYFKGRWGEALFLHTDNTEKLKRLYGEKHTKTLQSTRNMARLYYRYMDYEKATDLHQIAWDGLKETLGETHLETLISLEDLSMSYVRYETTTEDHLKDEHLMQTQKNMTFVYEQRKQRLGPEHPYTLLASLYLARVKSELGHHVEAERMIRNGLETAERNLGEKHIGVLMAKTIHGQVLTRLSRFAEAEEVFYALIDKEGYKLLADEDGDHPDRLVNIFFLAQCLQEQGKLKEALEISEEFLVGIATIGGQGRGLTHKILPRMRVTVARLQEKLRETAGKGEYALEKN